MIYSPKACTQDELLADGIIRSLERRLRQVNMGQGLGFKMANVVIDKKLLTQVATSLITVGSTGLGYILALADAAADVVPDGSICNLTDMEVLGLRDVMRFRNQSCSFGPVTVDDVLGKS